MKRAIIQNMTLEELSVAATWAQKEGWNPGLNDYKAFYAQDPKGFYTSKIDGEMIATLSAVEYEKSYVFLGFYMVQPRWRDQGHGYALWEHVLNSDRCKNKLIGLDGVIKQQKNYVKSGFQPAYKTVRYKFQHIVEPCARPESRGCFVVHTQKERNNLKEFDRKIFTFNRKNFLDSWLSLPSHHAFFHGSQTPRAGKCDGYGVIRKACEGFRIGPLFSSCVQDADALIESLSGQAKGENIYIDIPSLNKNTAYLIEKYNMKPCFETIRMYNRLTNLNYSDSIYAMASLEIG